MEKIKVVHYGIGVIGQRIIKKIISKEWVELVGAIDVSKDLFGKDLGVILGLEKEINIKVSNIPDKVFSETKPDIVIHTTQSYVKQVFDQLTGIIKNRVNIVSTCEELSNPYVSSPSLSKQIDDLAKQYGVTVLGTGINPGFLMDYLPIILTGPCEKVEKIEVKRLMNASKRRVPFQKKIGAGLTPEEFESSLNSKLITGHVGLEQSLGLIADSLKWKLDDIRISSPKPVISNEGVSSDAISVKPGNVCGIMQDAKGYLNSKEVLVLDFKAFLGSEDEFDSIQISGIPNITQKIEPCINGDIGTVSMVINSIPRVIEAPPGLITMKDLPPPIAIP